MTTNTQAARPAAVVTPPRLGLGGTLLLFGGGGALLYAATRGLIPLLQNQTGIEPVVCWFIAAGLGVFTPLLIVAVVILAREPRRSQPFWRDRLRFRRMNAGDWLWSAAGLVAIGVLVALTMTAMQRINGEVDLHPSFMRMQPLTPDRYWILAVWLPFWIVNIMGEEVLWRGVVLPRQEVVFGRWAWFVNALGWLLFHVPFGPDILLTLGPTTLIVPFIAQRRKNSWTAVIMHAGLNGPGFIAVAFGLT